MIKRSCSAGPRRPAPGFASIVAVCFALAAPFAAAGRARIEAGRRLPGARRVQRAEELKMAPARPVPAWRLRIGS
jgi:hypothetical protein